MAVKPDSWTVLHNGKEVGVLLVNPEATPEATPEYIEHEVGVLAYLWAKGEE